MVNELVCVTHKVLSKKLLFEILLVLLLIYTGPGSACAGFSVSKVVHNLQVLFHGISGCKPVSFHCDTHKDTYAVKISLLPLKCLI